MLTKNIATGRTLLKRYRDTWQEVTVNNSEYIIEFINVILLEKKNRLINKNRNYLGLNVIIRNSQISKLEMNK